jgi:hypothetical protein
MVARLQCWRVSNPLGFCGATTLMMTMVARWRSPRILDSFKTAMARLRSDLLNDWGKTAISARQQSPSIWRCNIFDNGMAARWKSSRILDNSNTAMSAHRQPP